MIKYRFIINHFKLNYFSQEYLHKIFQQTCFNLSASPYLKKIQYDKIFYKYY